ncbi:MAG: right-handed parallel beta-helix repeat-containing protein [Candidatus Nomurabacteria bacterium]|nr:right-handed parallel beta-helix repeat-containing protein [Candidatus Nomurabacteria bacterium]USN87638.1 MAG: right-handed parallel beta-helix repeat-containing protein [Candidatus Nomurabacteria bacterium]
MPTLHHLLQTTLTFLFTLTLSFVSVYIPQPYHQVNHAEAGVATFSGQLMGLAEQAVSAAANVMSAAIESVIRFKELVWDPLAWSVAKGMIAVMTASVVRWINSGFQGSPAFVQDLEYYLSRVGDRVFGEFVNELGIAPFVCRPFRLDLQIALNIGYQRHYRAGYPIGATYCSLEGALANIDNFVNGSFNDGGWDTWYTVTTRPNTYTPYGNFLSVSGEAALRINNQQVNATRFLNFGDGFMSKAICSQIPLITGGAITRERCAVSTPGQVINQTLNHHLGAGLDSLIAADEIGEIIGALVGQLAQKSLEGAAGLLGLSGGTGYTDPSYGTSYLDAAITQQAASSSEAVAQADQLSNNTYNQAANQAEQQGQQRADNAQAGADSTTNTGIDTTNIDQALQNLIDILGGGGTIITPTDPNTTTPPIGLSGPIGPQPVAATPLSSGTIFAAPNGSGTACTEVIPCTIQTAIDKARAGDVVFLFGGTYQVSKNIDFNNQGTAANPVIYESYPGEKAVFDGSTSPQSSWAQMRISGNFIYIRGMVIREMPKKGLEVLGADNLIEGMEVYNNTLSGIQIQAGDGAGTTVASRNIIRNNIVRDNSAAGLFEAVYNDGGNTDGIAISYGYDNRIENNLVYRNSDDGIDTWRGVRSYVGYNISYSNGIAKGEGNGVKAGGSSPSKDTVVERNLVYSNKSNGINYNSGVNVTMSYNTTWNNGLVGYKVGSDTILTKNISSGGVEKNGAGIESNNSWQRSGTVQFISTDPNSPDFLRPTVGGGFEDIGVYAGTTAVSPSQPSTVPVDVYLIGDSTVSSGSGWGDFLKDYLRTEATVINAAISGRSSKSYYDEGSFNSVRSSLAPGDYLLIQFGHNDQHLDDIHYTNPGTAPAYNGTFRDYLELYINEARAKGAIPVLITPVSRMVFTSTDQHIRSHGEYAPAVRKIAADNNVILLDLEERSHQVFNNLGETQTLQLYAGYGGTFDDRTHFPPEKAFRVTEMVVTLLRNSSSLLRGYLLN